ncbi:unnamed protein product [Pieris brassicae]|uniref:Uncharacterized protein n=1 Tax=Pieris brassicae TaxID=7116 RepID=A0A9P0SW84_PIEBR|nr:unnamed protein product [Pieris brassicae]
MSSYFIYLFFVRSFHGGRLVHRSVRAWRTSSASTAGAANSSSATTAHLRLILSISQITVIFHSSSVWPALHTIIFNRSTCNPC